MSECHEQAKQWGKRDVVLVVRYENIRGEWKSMDSVRLSDRGSSKHPRAYPRKVKPLMVGTGRSKKAIVIYQTTPPPGKCKDCGKFRRAEWFPDHLDKHDAPLAGGYYDQEDV